jgi:ERF superfamily
MTTTSPPRSGDTPAEELPPAKNVQEAIMRLHRALPVVKKEREAEVTTDKGRTYTYDYADIADVSEAMLPLLPMYDLAWSCTTNYRDGRLMLEYELMHVPSDTAKTGVLPLLDAKTPQGIGSQMSFWRRYALCAVTGLAPKGDDVEIDDNPRSTAARRRQPAATNRPTTSTAARTRRAVTGEDEPPPGPDDPASTPTLQRLAIGFGKLGVSDRDERIAISGALVDRQVTTGKEFTQAQAGNIISIVERAQRDDPEARELFDNARRQVAARRAETS